MPELDSQYRSEWLSVADKLANQGLQVTDVSLPHFKYGVPCYNVVNCAEVVSNMAKYTGLIFGKLLLLLFYYNLQCDTGNVSIRIVGKLMVQHAACTRNFPIPTNN